MKARIYTLLVEALMRLYENATGKPFTPDAGDPPKHRLTGSELYKIVGYLSAELPELHKVEAPRLIDAVEKAIARVGR